jgi:hypothetical protein
MTRFVRPRRWPAGVVVTGLLFTAVPVSADAGRPVTPAREITETRTGASAARAAAERITEVYGIPTSAAELDVWQVGARRLVGPSGSLVAAREVIGSDGETGLVVSATEPIPANRDPSPVRIDAAAVPAANGWRLVGDHCWIDATRESAFMDVCYHKWKATSDGSITHDYYLLDMFSTFATPGFGLETGDPWIHARLSPSSPDATWFKWKPGTDTTQCGGVNLSIAVNGIPLSVTGNQCETWNITKYADPGAFRNGWIEGICQIQREERELEFTVAVRVAQGKVPTWNFDWYEHVQMASCLA